MKNQFLRITGLVILCLSLFVKCESEDESNSSDNSLYGVWVRTNGPSGDETNIAIGGIEGEPENRVYMCEWVGAVGLYKGFLNGNTITWDSQYNYPDAQVRRVGSQLEFYYPSISWSIPTLYDAGSWSSNCGELENISRRIAVGLNNDLVYGAIINDVTIDGYTVPLNLLNSTTTAPDCSTNSFLTLGEPVRSDNRYEVKITSTQYTVDLVWVTTTYTSYIIDYNLSTDNCNIFQVWWGHNGFGLMPM